MTTAQFEAELLKLPRSVRARLVERLLASLEESEIDVAWAREADRRFETYRNGDESALPLEDVLEAIRRDAGL
jgi:putative addiction module component (TIGR02574 family)